MQTFIINTYYNDVVCYADNLDDGRTFVEFSAPYHYSVFAHPRKDVVNCSGISDNAGFVAPATKMMILLVSGGSLWLLPSTVQ
ncbi:MAG: hypothetical protein ORN24_03355 [Burkholderiales bacterium]|nr:hypothetical protein [Burkholderiales bacterium]